jgi:hypothetical protein
MSQIKAIETRYKGYRFRSRLEARWAVFFDAIGVKWEYEKEGFNLQGEWYLPDFWINDWNCWIEIKPKGDPDDRTLGCCELLRYESSENEVYLVCGEPWLGEYEIHFWSDSDSSAGWDAWTAIFTRCRRCESHCLLYVENKNSTDDAMGYSDLGKHTCGDHDKYPVPESLLKAYSAARSARFEHGESGASVR